MICKRARFQSQPLALKLLFTFQNKVFLIQHLWLLASLLKSYRIVQPFLVVLVLYLHSFLKLDHEGELGEDGQIPLFRHGELRRL